jgi:hypothetical protein
MEKSSQKSSQNEFYKKLVAKYQDTASYHQPRCFCQPEISVAAFQKEAEAKLENQRAREKVKKIRSQESKERLPEKLEKYGHEKPNQGLRKMIQAGGQANLEKKLKKPKKKSKKFPLPLYPTSPNDITSFQTFQINYTKKLSLTAKSILNSFQKKYLYWAIDDILYLLKTNVSEQKNILALLYSPVISLQNNFYVNFFDIWIDELYIEEISHGNRFLQEDFQTSEPTCYITLKLWYRESKQPKKKKSYW